MWRVRRRGAGRARRGARRRGARRSGLAGRPRRRAAHLHGRAGRRAPRGPGAGRLPSPHSRAGARANAGPNDAGGLGPGSARRAVCAGRAGYWARRACLRCGRCFRRAGVRRWTAGSCALPAFDPGLFAPAAEAGLPHSTSAAPLSGVEPGAVADTSPAPPGPVAPRSPLAPTAGAPEAASAMPGPVRIAYIPGAGITAPQPLVAPDDFSRTALGPGAGAAPLWAIPAANLAFELNHDLAPAPDLLLRDERAWPDLTARPRPTRVRSTTAAAPSWRSCE